jgi:hypothetical protein
MGPARTASVMVALACCAPGCDDYFYVCPVDGGRAAELPARLSQTGLYDETGALADDVFAYRPAFELWADGADKQRFLRLPARQVIDTSDMDSWRFPAGTRVWKEFSQGGRALETRLIEKVGPAASDWAAVSYVWGEDGEDAVASPTGYLDVLGSQHDAPGAGECIGCHGGRASYLLGLSAIQLAAPAAPGELDLAGLEARGLLSDPPAADLSIPGTEIERAALGYLHANCGHCHNQTRPGRDISPCMDPDNSMDFFLSVDDLGSVEATATYRTVVGDQIEPGDPASSKLIERAGTRTLFYRMPPLGSETVDDAAIELLERWIEEMR